MSTLDYLESAKAWEGQRYSLDTPPLTGGMYHILSEFHLEISDPEARIIFSLSSPAPTKTKDPKDTKEMKSKRKENEFLKTNERSSSGKTGNRPLDLMGESESESFSRGEERKEVSRKLGLLSSGESGSSGGNGAWNERAQSGDSGKRLKTMDREETNKTSDQAAVSGPNTTSVTRPYHSTLLEKLVRYRLIQISEPGKSGKTRQGNPSQQRYDRSGTHNRRSSHKYKVNESDNSHQSQTIPNQSPTDDQLDPRISSNGLFQDSFLRGEGPASPNFQLKLKQGKYLLLLEARPFRNFEPQALSVRVAWKGRLLLEQNPDLNCVDYSGEYAPNKYYTLFRDRLIFGSDTATFSFHLQLFNHQDDISESEDVTNMDLGNTTSNKKKGEEPKTGEVNLKGLRPLKRDVHMVVELLHKERVVHRFGGRKEVFVSSVTIHRKGEMLVKKDTATLKVPDQATSNIS